MFYLSTYLLTTVTFDKTKKEKPRYTYLLTYL